MRTLITNGTVITATETMAADVLIEHEQVIALEMEVMPEDELERALDLYPMTEGGIAK